jgi:hypothetical protein
MTTLLTMALAHLLNSPALPPMVWQATIVLDRQTALVGEKPDPFKMPDKPNPFDDIPPRLQ